MRKLTFAVLGLVFFAALGGLYLLNSPEGLRFVIRQAGALLPGTLTVQSVGGRLLGPIRLTGVRYADATGAQFSTGHIQLNWRPGALLEGMLAIDRLSVEEVDLIIPSTADDQPDKTPTDLPQLSLPVSVALRDIDIESIAVRDQDGRDRAAIQSLRGQLDADRDGITMRDLAVHTPHYSVRADGSVIPRGDYPLNLRIAWSATLEDFAPAEGLTVIAGDLSELDMRSDIRTPVPASLNGTIRGLLDSPTWTVDLSAREFSLRAVRGQWPEWKTAGNLTAKGDLSMAEIDGSVTVQPPALPTLSVEGSLSYARDHLQIGTLKLTAAQLPTEVSLSGGVALTAADPILDLRGGWAAAQWPLQGQSPWRSPSGEFAAQGRIDDLKVSFTGSLAADLAAAGLPDTAALELDVTGDGHWQAGRLDLRELTASEVRGDARLAVAGQITLPDAQDPVFALDGDWQGFRWPVVGTPDWLSPEGRVKVSGTMSRLSVATEATVTTPALPDARLAVVVAGQWHEPRVELNRFTLTEVDGTASISATGALVTSDAGPVQVQVSGEWRELRWPLGQTAEWSSANGVFSANGRVDDLAVSMKGLITPQQLNAGVNGIDAQMQLDARWSPQRLAVQRLLVQEVGGAGRLNLAGVIAHTRGSLDAVDVTGDWGELRWPLHRPVWHSAAGRFQVSGDPGDLAISVDGTLASAGNENKEAPLNIELNLKDLRDAPQILGTARVPFLAYREYAVQTLEADVNLDATDKRRSELDIRAAHLKLGEREATNLRIHGQGFANAHALNATGAVDGSDFKITAEGQYLRHAWQGSLKRATISKLLNADWDLVAPVELQVSPARFESTKACWQSQSGRICAAGAWREGDWQATARVDSVPASVLRDSLARDLEWAGSFQADAEVRGDRSGRVTGHAKLELGSGELSYTTEGETVGLSYHDARGDLELNDNALRGHVAAKLDREGAVEADFSVSDPFAVDTPAQQMVHGQGNVRIPDVKVLQTFFPQLAQTRGSLEFDVTARGTMQNPVFNVAAKLDVAATEIRDLGIKLTELDLSARNTSDTRVHVVGQMQSGPGVLKLDGELDLARPREWRADFRLTGERFELVNVPEARLLATPDLRLMLQKQRIDLSGRVDIPEAHLRPQASVAPNVTISPDVVIVEPVEQPETESKWRTHAKMKLGFGEQVIFEGYGIEGKLTGELEVTEEPERLTTARGEIEIKDGTYSFYGQKLSINPGRLVFAGGAIDDPGLDARAIREIRDVIAGVQIRGTARRPELSVFSTPSLPETEALSYLLLGRPTSEADRAGGALLFKAATSLLPKGSSDLTGQIKSLFGLEQLGLQSADGADEGTQLVLGKYLSPKLYVSYAAGLADALNVFQVRYELTKRWTLQSQSSAQESGGDLLYSIER